MNNSIRRAGYSTLTNRLRTAHEVLTQKTQKGGNEIPVEVLLEGHSAGRVLRNTRATLEALVALLGDSATSARTLDLDPKQMALTVSHRLAKLVSLLETKASSDAQEAQIKGNMGPANIANAHDTVRAGRLTCEAFQAAAEQTYLGHLQHGKPGMASRLAALFAPSKGGAAQFDASLVDTDAMKTATHQALRLALADMKQEGTATEGVRIVREMEKGGFISEVEASEARAEAVLHFLSREHSVPRPLAAFRDNVDDGAIQAARRVQALAALDLVKAAQFDWLVREFATVSGLASSAVAATVLVEKYEASGIISPKEARAALLEGLTSATISKGPEHSVVRFLEAKVTPTKSERVEVTNRRAQANVVVAEDLGSRFIRLAQVKSWMPAAIYLEAVRDVAYYAHARGQSITTQLLADVGALSEVSKRQPASMVILPSGEMFDLRRALSSMAHTKQDKNLATLLCDVIGPAAPADTINELIDGLQRVVDNMRHPEFLGFRNALINGELRDGLAIRGRALFGDAVPSLAAIVTLRAQVRELLAARNYNLV